MLCSRPTSLRLSCTFNKYVLGIFMYEVTTSYRCSIFIVFSCLLRSPSIKDETATVYCTQAQSAEVDKDLHVRLHYKYSAFHSFTEAFSSLPQSSGQYRGKVKGQPKCQPCWQGAWLCGCSWTLPRPLSESRLVLAASQLLCHRWLWDLPRRVLSTIVVEG